MAIEALSEEELAELAKRFGKPVTTHDALTTGLGVAVDLVSKNVVTEIQVGPVFPDGKEGAVEVIAHGEVK